MSMMLTLPGLPHRLGHGHDGSVEWAALLARWPGRFEGDRVVCDGGVDDALAAVAERIEGLGVAAVVGPVDASLDGVPIGGRARALREALRYVREGEVFLLPGSHDVPDGVGVFEAPEAIGAALGMPVQVLKDYR